MNDRLIVIAQPLTPDAYHALLHDGTLHSGDPIELLEGKLVIKKRRTPKQAAAIRRLRRKFEALIPSERFVDGDAPLTTSDSEPEPAVIVICGEIEDFADRHPGPREVPLVVEIVEQMSEVVGESKQRVYARAALPCYWIVSLEGECVEVLTQPSGPNAQPTYRQRETYRVHNELPVVIDGKEIGRIAVEAILGARSPAK